MREARGAHVLGHEMVRRVAGACRPSQVMDQRSITLGDIYIYIYMLFGTISIEARHQTHNANSWYSIICIHWGHIPYVPTYYPPSP